MADLSEVGPLGSADRRAVLSWVWCPPCRAPAGARLSIVTSALSGPHTGREVDCLLGPVTGDP